MTTTLRVGGVPEHFNYPWQALAEQGAFAKAQLDILWQDFAGGTGVMAEALQQGQLDLALMLSEGAVAAIAKGLPARLLQWYVTSPLLWGIHTRPALQAQTLHDLEGKRIAISRVGSGSHLMAFVMAKQQGWDWQKLDFVSVQNLQGARQAFAEGQADVFLWEKFMTQPWVDAGDFDRVGILPTPWPCFVWVAHLNTLQNHAEALQRLQQLLNQAAQSMMFQPQVVEILAHQYNLQPTAVQEWLSLTTWAQDNHLEKTKLANIVQTLQQVGVLQTEVPPESLVSPDHCSWVV